MTATASSFWSPSQSPTNLVNNNGISAAYDITASHSSDGSAFGQWHAVEWVNDPNPTLTFYLGGSFNLAGIHIWNGNQGSSTNDLTARGVNAFTLSVSSNGVDYTDVLVNSSLAKSPFTGGTGPGPISAQDFDLTGQNNVSHVQLVVLSNHTGPNGNYTGLSEVMFTAAPIPEPGTGLLAGLGALALLRRKRA